MTLQPSKLALASALTFIVLWTVCSAAVHFFPTFSMTMSGHMIHASLNGVFWTLTWTGFIYGLIAWAVIAGVTGWLIAVFYSRSR